MSTMLAAKFIAPGKPLSLEEVEVPRPAPGSLLLRVRACGVCGSDLTIQKGDFPVPTCTTLGHEIAGETEDGRRYAVFYASGCGECAMCRRGWVVGCERGSVRTGVTRDGGFARFVAVPEKNLVPIPPGVSFAAAAVSTDAIATNLHALLDNGRLQAGETVAIFGLGGLGVAAIQIAKALGARVIAISRSPGKKELALSLGADEYVVGGEAPDSVQGLGVDLALQLVPNPAVDEQAIASVRQGGRVVLVGFTPHRFGASSLDLVCRQIQIVGSRGMTKANIEMALDWVAQGRIRVDALLSSPSPLQDINQVMDDFKSGKIVRAIIEP